ncbi:MAG: hypothetical protein HOC71_05025 [Candidatus Latescibacteria bacterium]|jgi:hypothetical protein|nr:hypothetical protein [Candidatus Latescibacterota bacterium]
MRLYIIEFDDIKKKDIDSIRVFYTSDNREIYNIFSSINRDERQCIKRLLTEIKQTELEKIAEYMIEQHTANNKYYMAITSQQAHNDKSIIEHAIEAASFKANFIKFD